MRVWGSLEPSPRDPWVGLFFLADPGGGSGGWVRGGGLCGQRRWKNMQKKAERCGNSQPVRVPRCREHPAALRDGGTPPPFFPGSTTMPTPRGVGGGGPVPGQQEPELRVVVVLLAGPQGAPPTDREGILGSCDFSPGLFVAVFCDGSLVVPVYRANKAQKRNIFFNIILPSAGPTKRGNPHPFPRHRHRPSKEAGSVRCRALGYVCLLARRPLLRRSRGRPGAPEQNQRPTPRQERATCGGSVFWGGGTVSSFTELGPFLE